MKKKSIRGKRNKGSDAKKELEAPGGLGYQLRECWLRCDKCGARRLVSQDAMSALTTKAYQEDWRSSLSDKEVKPGDLCSAVRWQRWLSGASARYAAWAGASRNCSRVDVAGSAVDEAVDGEEMFAGGDGDYADAGEGSAFGGVSAFDWAEAIQAVGSRVPREADGGYLRDEEKSFLDGGASQHSNEDGLMARVRFECDMLITKEVLRNA